MNFFYIFYFIFDAVVVIFVLIVFVLVGVILAVVILFNLHVFSTAAAATALRLPLICTYCCWGCSTLWCSGSFCSDTADLPLVFISFDCLLLTLLIYYIPSHYFEVRQLHIFAHLIPPP